MVLIDFNECEAKHDLCGNISTCENTIGGYLCICANGKKHDWNNGYNEICKEELVTKEGESLKRAFIIWSILIPLLIIVLLSFLIISVFLWRRLKPANWADSDSREATVNTQYWEILSVTQNNDEDMLALQRADMIQTVECDASQQLESIYWNEPTGSNGPAHTDSCDFTASSTASLSRPLLDRPQSH